MLRTLVDTWWAEAGRNQVLRLEDGFIGRAVAIEPSPWGLRGTAELARGGGPIALCVDGPTVARATVPRDLPVRWQIGGTGSLVGRDRGFPVSDDYQLPARFTGEIDKVVLWAWQDPNRHASDAVRLNATAAANRPRTAHEWTQALDEETVEN